MLVHYGHLLGKNKNINMEWRGSQHAVSTEDVVCRPPATCQDVLQHTERGPRARTATFPLSHQHGSTVLPFVLLKKMGCGFGT